MENGGPGIERNKKDKKKKQHKISAFQITDSKIDTINGIRKAGKGNEGER